MITQSPESYMPEPYKTYIKQRSESISKTLIPIIGDADIQLCPRAITENERIFSDPNSQIYGAVVKEVEHGHKSILYSDLFNNSGIATTDLESAILYATDQFQKGNRIRVKDPSESGGYGQHTIKSIDQLAPIFNQITNGNEFGIVLMPYMNKIINRLSIGKVALKGLWRLYIYGTRRIINA